MPRRFGFVDLLLVLAGIVVIATVVSFFQTNFPSGDPNAPFREAQQAKLAAMAKETPASMQFKRGDWSKTITDPETIREALGLLANAKDVSRHHSHPEDKITVTFAGAPEVYLLGRDSGRADEYWLELRTEGERGASDRTIVLLKSGAFTSWLRRNGVPLGDKTSK